MDISHRSEAGVALFDKDAWTPASNDLRAISLVDHCRWDCFWFEGDRHPFIRMYDVGAGRSCFPDHEVGFCVDRGGARCDGDFVGGDLRT